MGIELPGWLQYVGGLVGEKFPQGDETACRRQGDQWNHYADQLAGQQDAIDAAAEAALEGFASGVTHDALVPELNSLTSGDQSIEKIVEQLRSLANAVNDAATEIEFAKEMFILNLGILAASLAAMIASAWINWGAPAEMAVAIAATEAVLSQIIRAAIGKLVSEAALRIIERLAIRALEGAVINAAISGGMNAAVQGGQILQGHRHGFDLASFGQDVQAGAIQGAVAAPFLKGPETRTPGFHPSERLGEFGRSFAGNTLGGLAAQAPSGQFDLANAATSGAVFGAMDSARPTAKSVKDDWAGGGAPVEPPHTSDGTPEASPPKGPDLSDPAVASPAHDTQATPSSPSHADVPLNLGTADRNLGDPGTTHPLRADAGSVPNSATPSDQPPSASPHTSDSQPGPAQPTPARSSVSDAPTHSNSQAVDTPAARTTDSPAAHAVSGRVGADSGHETATAPPLGRHDTSPAPTPAGRAEAAPIRAADLSDTRPPRGPDLTDPSPRTPDHGKAAPPNKNFDRIDAAAPKSDGARVSNGAPTQPDSGKASPAAQSVEGLPKQTDSRPSTEPKAGQASIRKDAAAQPDSSHHTPGSPDAAAWAPLVLGPALGVGDSLAHVSAADTPRDPRAPQPGGPGVTERSSPHPARGDDPVRAGVVAGGGEPAARSHHIDASELPDYRQRQMELALSPENLERDLLNGGCPPEVAASARHSPYEDLTRQQLVERYCNLDGSVRWPPHDGFADGRYHVADHIPPGESLDRIGEVSPQRGDFLGSAGDSYPARALAPGSSGQYHRLEGTGKQFSHPTWELRYGKVAEAFDQPGGGRQWVVVDAAKIIDGAPQKILIDQLIKEGYVRAVEPDSIHVHGESGDKAHPDAPHAGSDHIERIRQLADEVHRTAHARGQAEPLFHGEELRADERQLLRDVWDELTPAERRHLFSREPMFGEHAGLPVKECDHYARQAIHDIRRDILERAHYREMTAGDQHQLRVLDNVENCLQHPPDAPNRFLLGFEPDGRSVTAVGNPDTAKATVVFVPGTFTNDERLNDHLAQPGFKNLFGLLDRPTKTGYMKISERIWDRLSDKLSTPEVAVVDYQNYHAPQDLMNPATGAPNPRFAHEGAPALRNHLDRLHDNGTGEFWVAGHSYGTVLVGEGAKTGGGLNADGIINLGSPGMRVHDISGLQLKGQHLSIGDGRVHTMTRVDDPIHIVDGARQTGLDRFGIGHGLMPHHPQFGGQIWRVDTNAGRQSDPHNAYFLPGNVALNNIAKIVAGEQPLPEEPRMWSARHPLPFTTGYFRPPPDEPWSAAQVDQSPPDLEDPCRHILKTFEGADGDPRELR